MTQSQTIEKTIGTIFTVREADGPNGRTVYEVVIGTEDVGTAKFETFLDKLGHRARDLEGEEVEVAFSRRGSFFRLQDIKALGGAAPRPKRAAAPQAARPAKATAAAQPVSGDATFKDLQINRQVAAKIIAEHVGLPQDDADWASFFVQAEMLVNYFLNGADSASQPEDDGPIWIETDEAMEIRF